MNKLYTMASITYLLSSLILPVSAKAISVNDTKIQIREFISAWDSDACAGICQTSRKFGICSLVEDLDKQVGGKIVGIKPKRKMQPLSISRSNLDLMKLIYSQCQISQDFVPPALKIDKNSKRFGPNCRTLPKIRQGLGLNPSDGQHYRNNCLPRK
jgi:hypothetical protein